MYMFSMHNYYPVQYYILVDIGNSAHLAQQHTFLVEGIPIVAKEDYMLLAVYLFTLCYAIVICLHQHRMH